MAHADARGRRAGDAMVTGPKTHHTAARADEIRAIFEDDHVHMALIVAADGRLVTTVERSDLLAAPPRTRCAAELGTLAGRTVRPWDGLDAVTAILLRDGRRRLAVVDDDGRDVAADGGEVGEVITRANVVMAGYWRQPEATDAVIVDGWFHTGDMGTIDREGYIEVVDRKKDLIISGGENISSIEVEGLLYRHAAVLEAAVIAAPDERWGEVPYAVVVLKPGAQATEPELIEFCRERLAHFKCPKRVDFIDVLPRTATGKVQKNVLRERFWKGEAKRVN
jgi:acyl-CoA synthetase (AMP-forming)/AMP-acid ligase II